MKASQRAAQRANVTPKNLRRLELGLPVPDADRRAVRHAFETLGMSFYQNDDGDTGVIVKPFTLSMDESLGEGDDERDK